MPLTKKGKKTKRAMVRFYHESKGKTPEEAKGIFYAYENKQKSKGLVKGK